MLRTGLLLLALGAAGCLATPIPIPLADGGADTLSPTAKTDGSRSLEAGVPPPPRDLGALGDREQSGWADATGEGRRDGLSSDGLRDGLTGEAGRDGLSLDGGTDATKLDAKKLDATKPDAKKQDGP